MATSGTKLALLLGLFMAASLLAAAQPEPDRPTVTIRNPALMALDIMVDDKNVRVATASTTLDINREEQHLQISAGGGESVDVTVHDGDVIVVMSDPADPGNLRTYKVIQGGEEPRPDVAGGGPDVAGVERRPASRKVLPANLPNANEPWPDMRP